MGSVWGFVSAGKPSSLMVGACGRPDQIFRFKHLRRNAGLQVNEGYSVAGFVLADALTDSDRGIGGSANRAGKLSSAQTINPR
jgi:hypothetical protein